MIKKIFDYKIQEKDDNKTIKQILYTLNISRRIITNVKKINGILLNGVNVNITQIVKTNDIIELMIEDDESENIIPEKMILNIIYEDEDILIINKPPNMVVHPTSYNFTGTLANGIMYYFKQQGLNAKFRVVNRLDKDTSGLVLIAKSQLSHSILSNQLISKTLKKEYIAVVHNKFEKTRGTIDAPIGRKPGSIIERYVTDEGQQAITEYNIINQNIFGAIVKIKLLTGRTHQIRVHFSHIGHCLYGDTVYGNKDIEINRQALHCYKLEFVHPKKNETMIFTYVIPEDMKKLIKKLDLEIVV